jgi:hypothetical protein
LSLAVARLYEEVNAGEETKVLHLFRIFGQFAYYAEKQKIVKP